MLPVLILRNCNFATEPGDISRIKRKLMCSLISSINRVQWDELTEAILGTVFNSKLALMDCWRSTNLAYNKWSTIKRKFYSHDEQNTMIMRCFNNKILCWCSLNNVSYIPTFVFFYWYKRCFQASTAKSLATLKWTHCWVTRGIGQQMATLKSGIWMVAHPYMSRQLKDISTWVNNLALWVKAMKHRYSLNFFEIPINLRVIK